MKIYRIKDWSEHYENNRSRTVRELSWVPIPNRHDGEGFTAIMAHERSAEIFAAWILMLQVASRCQPRGSLLRDGGRPHTAASLALRTRGRAEWFSLALDFLASPEIGWIEESQDAESANDARACQPGVSRVSAGCQPPDAVVTIEEGRNGIEGTEGKYTQDGARTARLHGIPSTAEEVIAFGKTLHPPKDEETCRAFFSHYEGQARTGPSGELFWVTSGDAVVTRWKEKLKTFGDAKSGCVQTSEPAWRRLRAAQELLKAAEDRKAKAEFKSDRKSADDARSEIKRLKPVIEQLNREVAGL